MAVPGDPRIVNRRRGAAIWRRAWWAILLAPKGVVHRHSTNHGQGNEPPDTQVENLRPQLHDDQRASDRGALSHFDLEDAELLDFAVPVFNPTLHSIHCATIWRTDRAFRYHSHGNVLPARRHASREHAGRRASVLA